MVEIPTDQNTKKPRLVLYLIVLVMAVIGTIGGVYYHQQSATLRLHAEEQLSAVADLKVTQVMNWRTERLNDAHQIQEMPVIKRQIARFLSTEDAEAGGDLRAWMKSLHETCGYSRVVIVDGQYRVRLAVPAGEAWIGPFTRQGLEQAWSADQVIVADLHRSPISGRVNMDFLVPLPTPDGNAALVLEVETEQFLFPLIQTWPTPSRSAETILVRREGDDVVYLNELRHRKNTMLSLRVPVNDFRLPAAQVVSGSRGVVEGTDYRGERVVADVRAVPGSPWFMEVKVDRSEIYEAIRQQGLGFLIAIVTMMLAVGSGLFIFWQRRELESSRQRMEEVQRAEEVLVKEQRLLSSLIQTIPDHIYFKDRESRFLRVNQALVKMFGVGRPEDVVGKTDFDFFSSEHAQQAYEDEQRVMTSGEPLIGKEEKETWSDGSVTWVSSTKVPIRDREGKVVGLVGISRDVTAHRELEDQLRQSQKMQAIGQLAGGVAHDFNNMLTAIIGYSSVVLQRLPANDPSRTSIEEIAHAADRSAGLTRQLLAFSRRQTLQPKLLNFNDVISEMQKMLVRLIGEQVELTTHLAKELKTIRADRTQVEQVIMNLVLNARDAMAGQSRQSRLTIETSNVTLDETYTRRFKDVVPGDYILVSVSDNGCGMSEEVKARLFEPFFTTKELGKGLGLGLATCYGVVKQSGGHIAAYSELGIGTTFKVYFPPFRGAVPVSGTVAMETEVRRGSEAILLVEDEEVVRDLVALVLREAGYTVFEAGNGVQALQLLRQLDGNAPVLLITDVIMPEMDGRRLADEVLQLHPKMKIIFTSGYTEDVIGKEGILDSGVVLIQKPFTPAMLAKKVREVLDR